MNDFRVVRGHFYGPDDREKAKAGAPAPMDPDAIMQCIATSLAAPGRCFSFLGIRTASVLIDTLHSAIIIARRRAYFLVSIDPRFFPTARAPSSLLVLHEYLVDNVLLLRAVARVRLIHFKVTSRRN